MGTYLVLWRWFRVLWVSLFRHHLQDAAYSTSKRGRAFVGRSFGVVLLSAFLTLLLCKVCLISLHVVPTRTRPANNTQLAPCAQMLLAISLPCNKHCRPTMPPLRIVCDGCCCCM